MLLQALCIAFHKQMPYNAFFNPLAFLYKNPCGKIKRKSSKKNIVKYLTHNNKALLLGNFNLPSSYKCIAARQKIKDGFTDTLFWLFFIKNKGDLLDYDRYGFYITGGGNDFFLIKTTLYTNLTDSINLHIKNAKKETVLNQNLSLALSHSYYLPLAHKAYYSFEFTINNTLLKFSFAFQNQTN